MNKTSQYLPRCYLTVAQNTFPSFKDIICKRIAEGVQREQILMKYCLVRIHDYSHIIYFKYLENLQIEGQVL